MTGPQFREITGWFVAVPLALAVLVYDRFVAPRDDEGRTPLGRLWHQGDEQVDQGAAHASSAPLALQAGGATDVPRKTPSNAAQRGQPDEQTQVQRPPVITMPSWIVRPEPVFPASAVGVERARVTISCTLPVTGTPRDCAVLQADPAGRGFEEAALESLGRASARPKSLNGVPETSEFQFSITFSQTPPPGDGG